MKIVADKKIRFLQGAFDSVAQVVTKEGKEIAAADVADADVLFIRTRTKCDARLLDGSSVRSIFTATIGFDHIDTDYCREHGIYWQNAPGCNAASVQQYIFSALAVLRSRYGYALRGQTLAIVGVGNVGKLVEKWANVLGMNVLRVDPLRAEAEGKEGFCDYYEALAKADIVTFHTPLVRTGKNATYYLFDREAISHLKQGAVVLNTSRGEVFDTKAVVDGLRNGRISHAVIDVWENEPNISKELIDLADIATPHVAGYSSDSKRNASQMSADAFFDHYGLAHTWKAAELAPPAEPEISIESGASEIDAACEMFLATYDILSDDGRLRTEPSGFESQRGNYPVRREVGAFHLAKGAPHADYLRKFGIR